MVLWYTFLITYFYFTESCKIQIYLHNIFVNNSLYMQGFYKALPTLKCGHTGLSFSFCSKGCVLGMESLLTSAWVVLQTTSVVSAIILMGCVSSQVKAHKCKVRVTTDQYSGLIPPLTLTLMDGEYNSLLTLVQMFRAGAPLITVHIIVNAPIRLHLACGMLHT